MRIPRLNRRGKLARNLLAVVLLSFALWVYTGFPAPTEGLALQWETERYFTEPGEIVLRVDQTDGASPWLKWFADRESVLTYRDGHLTCYQHQRWLTAHTMDYEGTYPIVDGECAVAFSAWSPEQEFYEAQVTVEGRTVTIWVERME